MIEAVSTIMGINFFSQWKLCSTSTLLLDNSPIAPSIVAGLIVVCFSVGVQACSGLTPGCTLNKVSHIFQVIIYWLSSLFAFIAALVPPSQLLAWAPSRNRTIFDIIDSDNDKFTLTLTISNQKNDESERH